MLAIGGISRRDKLRGALLSKSCLVSPCAERMVLDAPPSMKQDTSELTSACALPQMDSTVRLQLCPACAFPAVM